MQNVLEFVRFLLQLRHTYELYVVLFYDCKMFLRFQDFCSSYYILVLLFLLGITGRCVSCCIMDKCSFFILTYILFPGLYHCVSWHMVGYFMVFTLAIALCSILTMLHYTNGIYWSGTFFHKGNTEDALALTVLVC